MTLQLEIIYCYNSYTSRYHHRSRHPDQQK